MISKNGTGQKSVSCMHPYPTEGCNIILMNDVKNVLSERISANTAVFVDD